MKAKINLLTISKEESLYLNSNQTMKLYINMIKVKIEFLLNVKFHDGVKDQIQYLMLPFFFFIAILFCKTYRGKIYQIKINCLSRITNRNRFYIAPLGKFIFLNNVKGTYLLSLLKLNIILNRIESFVLFCFVLGISNVILFRMFYTQIQSSIIKFTNWI